MFVVTITDRDALRSSYTELLDLLSAELVEGRRGLVEQNHSRSRGDARAIQSRCWLVLRRAPSRSPSSWSLTRAKVRRAEALFDYVAGLAHVPRDPCIDAQACRAHWRGSTLWEGVGLWNTFT